MKKKASLIYGFSCFPFMCLWFVSCVAMPPPDMRRAEEIMQTYDGSTAVKYTIPGMNDVLVANVEYKDGLKMDIYYPPNFDFKSSAPVVVFPFSYADEQIFQWFGLDKLKNMEQYVTWGPLLGASGMISVMYESDYPYDDTYDAMRYITDNAKTLGIDSQRIGVWACSSNPLVALEVLADKHHDWGRYVKCGVLYYPYIQHFLRPSGGNAPVIQTLKKRPRPDVPLYIVKAGKDDDAANEALDLFVEKLIDLEVPLEYVNFEDGAHGFDVYDGSEESREIIKQTIEFFKQHLEV